MQSPNFVHGVSGWKIAKDGSAEFQDVVLPAGSGGAVVTFASTAPAMPNTGDLWYNTSAGLEVSQWNGSSWVAYQLSSGALSATAGITSGQVSFTATSIGGITTYVQSTAPSGSINAGSLWIDTSAGNALYQYNSGSWTLYQFGSGSIAANSITATQIAANTITASQLAAGIVYAGIVNSTTVNAATFTGSVFEGTDFIINSSGAFFYSGTPASGNLVGSWAQTSGTDGYGNTYPAGLVVGASAHPQIALTPMVGAAAQVQFPITTPALSNTPNIAGVGGTSSQQAIMDISGPAIAATGFKDWVQILLYSNDTGGDGSVLKFVTIDTSGTPTISAQMTPSGWTFFEPADFNTLKISGIQIVPQGIPGLYTIPQEPYSGTGWVSGERAWMNSNWVDEINYNFSQIMSCLYNAGIAT